MNRTFLALSFCTLFVFSLSIAVYARDVEVSNIELSVIDESTAIIYYTLTRDNPEIHADQPIWIFVKYRLSEESDHMDWKDTDDLDYTNDDSDGRFDSNNGSRNDVYYTVNENLQWDVGIVESSGDKQIFWTWGETGTGIPHEEIEFVEVAVYPIEMVGIPGGEITFGSDSQAWNWLTGTAMIDNLYMTKYLITTKMYAAFLNYCANRHDQFVAYQEFAFYYKPGMNGSNLCRLKKISGSINDGNAVFDAVEDYESVAMTYVTWYNAYDFAKWAGLRMITGEEFEYEATNGGTRDFPWGDTIPDNGSNMRANMKGVYPDNASSVYSYDKPATWPFRRKSGLSVNGVADLAGNIWKWCFTVWYTGEYDASFSVEPTAEYGPALRVVRGAAYSYEEYRLRGAGRSMNHPGDRNSGSGFILAR